MRNWLTHLKSIQLFPAYCTFCQSAVTDAASDICNHCREALPSAPLSVPQNDQLILYAFHYQPPISHALLKVKFGQSLAHVRLLGQLTAQQLLPRITDKPEVIIPMPLHNQRLRQRGFNQSLELVRPLAKSLQVPVLLHTIKRHKSTLAQTTLNAEQRFDNVQQAFSLVKPISCQHVAIFDDVMTTGATLQALAQQLQANGVERIDFYTCARTLM